MKTDMNGKKYIDFNSQAMCSSLGHTCPPSVVEAVTKQMQELPMTYAVDVRTDFVFFLVFHLGQMPDLLIFFTFVSLSSPIPCEPN